MKRPTKSTTKRTTKKSAERTAKRRLCGIGIWAVLGASAALGGCGRVEPNGFEGSVPTKQTVAVIVPSSGTAATASAVATGTTIKADGHLGGVASDYTFTVAITTIINGGVGAVLDLVKTVVSYPPTSVVGEAAVWGPYHDPLSANTWRLTVTRTAPHVFAWQFDGRDKNADDSAFVTVLSGSHTQVLDAAGNPIENYGSGSFTLDWNAADTLPQHDANQGTAAFTYSRLGPAATATVNVSFKGIVDNCDVLTCHTHGETFDALYAYSATPGSGGDLQYAATEDFDQVAGSTLEETLSLQSRWMETGAGRTDIQVTGGDLSTNVVTSSECWDQNFASEYSVSMIDPTQDWGAESSCVFPTAAFVSLSP